MRLFPAMWQRHNGFYSPSLVTVFLVVIFIAALFGTRVLNRPEPASAPAEVRYSERYFELRQRSSLNAAEEAELKLETCRYERDTIKFLKTKPFANLETEVARYLRSCNEILPLE